MFFLLTVNLYLLYLFVTKHFAVSLLWSELCSWISFGYCTEVSHKYPYVDEGFTDVCCYISKQPRRIHRFLINCWQNFHFYTYEFHWLDIIYDLLNRTDFTFFFFAKTTVFGLIMGMLINQNSVSLSLMMLVVMRLVDSFVKFRDLLCLIGEKKAPRMAVVSVWNVISK